MGFPASAQVMTFIPTRDRDRSTAFYAGVLGFPLVREDPFAAVIDLNGTPLRITPIDDHAPTSHTILGWTVPDIHAAVAALKARGVTFSIYDGFGQDADGIWTSPASDAKVAWFTDPDGNVLSLTEF